MGQELPRTEEQIRSLMLSYRREKTLSRLVELTTDADPDAADEAETEEELAEEDAIANAEAAAIVGETETTEEEPATATPLPDDQSQPVETEE